MAKLTILEFPDPLLKIVAKPVADVTDKIRKLIDDMLETMYDAEGVGLAATQVGIAKRIFVMDISEDHSNPMVFINPEVTPITDVIADISEGCLSVPGFDEVLGRPEKVEVTALDRSGNSFKIICEDLMSVCVQHETDHLDGKLFIDYLSPLKRNRIRKKLEKNQRLNNNK